MSDIEVTPIINTAAINKVDSIIARISASNNTPSGDVVDDLLDLRNLITGFALPIPVVETT